MNRNALHLGYHYVRDGGAPGPVTTPERLRTHIHSLLNQGYKDLTCGQVGSLARWGKPLPEKHATLSFDDGLKDQYTTAFPILKEFGVRGTFFYITCALEGKLPPVIGFQIMINKLGSDRIRTQILPELMREYGLWSYARLLEGPEKFDHSGMKMGEAPENRLIKSVFNHFLPPSLQAEFIEKIFDRFIEEPMSHIVKEWFMSGDELNEMSEAGMEIAGHSVKHPWLSMIGASEIESEARQSREALRNVTNRDVTSFAWTFGLSAPRIEAMGAVANAGYSSAWNFWTKPEDVPGDDPYGEPYDIPRYNEAFIEV